MKESDGPIVAAVREARARIAEECNCELGQLAERPKKIESAHAANLRPSKTEHGKPLWMDHGK